MCEYFSDSCHRLPSVTLGEAAETEVPTLILHRAFLTESALCKSPASRCGQGGWLSHQKEGKQEEGRKRRE